MHKYYVVESDNAAPRCNCHCSVATGAFKALTWQKGLVNESFSAAALEMFNHSTS